MRIPGFFAPLNTATPAGVDRCVNLYREETGDPERPYAFKRRAGLIARVTGLHGPVRGGIVVTHTTGETLYVIAGQRMYAIAADWTATELGAVGADTRRAMMITNGSAGNQVAGVSNGQLWLYNTLTGVFGQVTDPDLPGNILGIIHTDLYALAWFRHSRAFRISSITDFSAWAGGDVAERSQYVDNIITMVADQTEVHILGAHAGETWWDSGNADFPFEPVPNAVWRQGSGATHGACLVGDTPYWMGRSEDGIGPIFRMRGGYIPERISSHWVERRIQGLTMVSDAYSHSYELEGHRFYVLTFPSEGVTLAFDEAVDPRVGWSEHAYHNPYTGQSEAHLGRCAFVFNGARLVGSRRDGTIYEQSLEAYDDAGDAIRAVRVFTGPQNDARPVFVHEMRLDAQTGVGTTTGQGADPVTWLRKSRDGGRTWGPELPREMGAIGEYGRRVRWNRLGRAEQPAWELGTTDPAFVAWRDCHADVEGAAH